MYHFSYFKEKDQAKILEFIHEHPFAFLTGSTSSGKQVATQIPILIIEREEQLYLQGHIMRNTDHHKALLENPQALVVFSGPSTYVSASWYTNPVSGSTWNYMSVHVSGELRFMSDDELVEFMKMFTLKFEEGNVQSLTIYDNLPKDYTNKMMPAIVGIELELKNVENVFKLSQNKDKESYLNIISKLEAQGGNSALIADEMGKRIPELFPPGAVWDANKFDS